MSEDRAGLFFQAGLREGRVREDLKDLQQETAQTNRDLQNLQLEAERTNVETALVVQDIFTMFRLVQKATGMQLGATAEAALTMIELGAFAYRQTIQMYATNPMLAPLVASLYVFSLALEFEALRGVQEQHREAQARLNSFQGMINLGARYD